MIRHIKNRWGKGKALAEIRAGIAVSLVLWFMLFIFAPFEIYNSNQDEFWYDLWTIAPFCLALFAIAAALSIIGFLIAYLISDLLYDLALVIFFWLFAAFYCQGNFFVSNLPPTDGTTINWSAYRSEIIFSTVFWGAVLAIVLLLWKLLKTARFRKAVTTVSVFFLAVLTVTLLTLGITGDTFRPKEFIKFTKDNMFEMSEDQNFIILLLDTVDADCFWEVWEQHPEYAEAMADFTYYNDTMTGYPYTDRAVPLILSGEWYENIGSEHDFKLHVYGESPFFEKLREAGYTLSIYNETQFEVGEMDGKFANMTTAKSKLSDIPIFVKRQIKLVGMKYAPYLLKQYCWFDITKLRNQHMGVTGKDLFYWDDKIFYDDVNSGTVTYADTRQFKLIHLLGAHVPFYYDADLNEIEDANYYTCIEASMTITMAYLNMLRESGVYDNSIILVLSDHGYNTSGDALTTAVYYENPTGRQHPILFIKGLNESHEVQVSGAPVSYDDLQTAYDRLLAGALSDEVFDWQEGDQRERRYLLYNFRGTPGQEHMIEYMQTGYAGDEDTMIPTGRVFDLQE